VAVFGAALAAAGRDDHLRHLRLLAVDGDPKSPAKAQLFSNRTPFLVMGRRAYWPKLRHGAIIG